ncbi:MAG: hypothetical protein C4308_11955 [Chitinophagaceae bacterium]
MNKGLIGKLLPHVIALAVFLIVTVIFCKPVLDGNTLSQHDIIGWKGGAQNAFEYKEKTGHFPLWNPNLFSGMPNYQVVMEGKSVLPNLTAIFSLGLPKPMNFFMLACICFYILCIALRVNPVISILGSLAFAFSTYNPIIIGVGHESKMFAIGYMPLLLAGMIFTFEKKYWLGLAVATIGAYSEIAVNHPQINFYFVIIALAVGIAYAVKWIMEKQWKHLLISAAIVIFAAIMGVAGSAISLLTSSEYAKATMRGGKTVEIKGDSVKAVKTTGLDTSYALRWSLGKAETFVVMMPEAFGGSSQKTLSENSKVVDKLTEKGIPEGQASQIAQSLPKYWGGMSDPSETTSGPPYVGATICILALIGFVVVKSPLRWGLLAATVLGILIAWGKYLPGFNTLLFNNVPLMNKFRAPSMTMVITELTLPVMAIVALQYILFRKNSQQVLQAEFKTILYAVAGLFALLILVWMMQDYSAPIDDYLLANFRQQAGNDEIGRTILSGMKADRKAMFGGQLLRAMGFALVIIGLLWFYMKNRIKAAVITVALTVVSTIDLLVIDKEYLNAEQHYVSEVGKEDFSKIKDGSGRVVADLKPAFDKIKQDQAINFRVYNPLLGYSDSRTSYFVQSITGYHPAKLRIYQDIIERYLSENPSEQVINMLNARYKIVQDPQTGQLVPIYNPNAFGAVWLVRHVTVAKDNIEELQFLGKSNLKDSAIVSADCAGKFTQPQPDSATIKLTSFAPDTLVYSFNSTQPQFAVFSEIYYPYGWNAYLDGKKVDYCKTNYVLRGMPVPAGQHIITFIFEPESYKRGNQIAYITSFIIWIVVIGGLFMHWRTTRQKSRKNA